MKIIQAAFLAFAISFVVGCDRKPAPQQVSDKPASAPVVAGHPVFRPEFETTEGTIEAGTAFLVKGSDTQNILVSALHLLGPAGGLPDDINPDAIGKCVLKITLHDLFVDSNELEFGVEPILIPDTAPMGEESKYGDVVAFRIPKDSGKPFVLSKDLPAVNSPVWMFTQLLDGAPKDQQLHRGIFTGIEDDFFWVAFDNPNLELRATSGAPILNSEGEVVAINLGGGVSEGVIFGAGNPVTRFAAPLLSSD